MSVNDEHYELMHFTLIRELYPPWYVIYLMYVG